MTTLDQSFTLSAGGGCRGSGGVIGRGRGNEGVIVGGGGRGNGGVI